MTENEQEQEQGLAGYLDSMRKRDKVQVFATINDILGIDKEE